MHLGDAETAGTRRRRGHDDRHGMGLMCRDEESESERGGPVTRHRRSLANKAESRPCPTTRGGRTCWSQGVDGRHKSSPCRAKRPSTLPALVSAAIGHGAQTGGGRGDDLCSISMTTWLDRDSKRRMHAAEPCMTPCWPHDAMTA